MEKQVIPSRDSQAGVTLMEMLIVTALIALLAGITFPSVTSGVDTLRLKGAADSTASFLNVTLNRAERRQQPMEVTISAGENAIIARGLEASSMRRLDLPDGIRIVAVYPEMPGETEVNRSVMLYPGGTIPGIGVELANRKNDRRIVRVDPTTGVPQIERPGNK